MTWGNPPKFSATPLIITGKKIIPEILAGDSEASHQKALFAWAALRVGKYPALAYMFAVPNGFFATIAQKGKMKAEGLRNGVWDIFLPFGIDGLTECRYHGCFIEMKIEKYRNHKDGGLTKEQVEFRDWIIPARYYCKVCYNWIEAKDTLVNYLELKV